MSTTLYTLNSGSAVLHVYCNKCNKECSPCDEKYPLPNWETHSYVAWWTPNKEEVRCLACSDDTVLERPVRPHFDLPRTRSQLYYNALSPTSRKMYGNYTHSEVLKRYNRYFEQ